MVINRAIFRSEKQDWTTPIEVYEDLNMEFGFNCDPCPVQGLEDGLSVEWNTCNFVNPPYNNIKAWMKKVIEEWMKGKKVVCLVPSRTDTKWWHDYAMQATEIRFIKGRLRFGGAKHNAPFPSVVLVFA